MKALSLWQYWASAMERGYKFNETRGWYLSYRGDLVICSAKRPMKWDEAGNNRELVQKMLSEKPLAYGCALCVVEVYDCVPSQNFIKSADRALLPLRTITHEEWKLGDYSPGRWVTLTKNLRRLTKPVPVRGRQSLFDLSPEEAAAVKVQLPSAPYMTVKQSEWENMPQKTREALIAMGDAALKAIEQGKLKL